MILKKSVTLNGINWSLDIPKKMASDLEDLVIETIQNKRNMTQKNKWTTHFKKATYVALESLKDQKNRFGIKKNLINAENFKIWWNYKTMHSIITKKSQAKETCKNYTKAHHNQIFQNQK